MKWGIRKVTSTRSFTSQLSPCKLRVSRAVNLRGNFWPLFWMTVKPMCRVVQKFSTQQLPHLLTEDGTAPNGNWASVQSSRLCMCYLWRLLLNFGCSISQRSLSLSPRISSITICELYLYSGPEKLQGPLLHFLNHGELKPEVSDSCSGNSRFLST